MEPKVVNPLTQDLSVFKKFNFKLSENKIRENIEILWGWHGARSMGHGENHLVYHLLHALCSRLHADNDSEV